MRYYLDTNIILFVLFDSSSLSSDVHRIISDYENILYTSIVCVQELIHLGQTGKIRTAHKDMAGLIADIEGLGVEIRPVGRKPLEAFARLPLKEGHGDPNDRLIIAQSMSDRIALISSDRKFAQYEREGLKFVFNRR